MCISMKKKIINLVLMGMVTLSITACGGNIPANQNDATDNVNTISENIIEESTTTEEVTNDTQDFEKKVASPMLDSFLDWTAQLYMIGGNAEFDSLTAEAEMSMVAFAIIKNNDYDESWQKDFTLNESSYYGYAIPADLINTYTNNYFGKTYDISSFESSENYPMVKPLEDGSFAVAIGEWGTMPPQYEIEEVNKNDGGSYSVKVNYFFYDRELSERSGVLATAQYTFEPYESSNFGYVITDMKFEKLQ